jgi:hypothetical protein
VSVVRREARRRRLLVAALVAVLCSLPVAVAALPVAPSSLGVDELRARIVASARTPYQGLAESRGSLGLPDLPGLSDVTGLLGSTTRMRVWYDAPRRWRVDVITPTGERGVRQSPQGTTTWDYERNFLIRVVGVPAVRLPRGSDLTPPDLARRMLAVAAPLDRVTELPGRRVAGVAAAGLRVTPADPTTTVGHVDVWADPASGLPVEVRITAKGSDRPVLLTRFLDLRQRRPAASVMAIRPPVGTPVIEASAPDLISRLSRFVLYRLPDRLADRPALSVAGGTTTVRAYGVGFSAFAVVPLPGRFGRRLVDEARAAGATEIEVTGPTGVPHAPALVIRTPLLTALAVADMDRTFLLAGPVAQDLLATAAAQLITGPGP